MILRVYDPAECDEHGVPQDWESCRTCAGTGTVAPLRVREVVMIAKPTCLACGGHGSLKTAALAHVAMRQWNVESDTAETFAGLRAHSHNNTIRCEDCGHPMSEGTWEGETTQGYTEAQLLTGSEMYLRKGGEPGFHRLHYSPCDEGCRHGLERGRDYVDIDHGGEASWRPVDIRTLGWPHDLRPDRLAVLCLRCWAARSKPEPVEPARASVARP